MTSKAMARAGLLAAALALAGCEGLDLPGSGGGAEATALPARGAVTRTAQDVERPDIFGLTAEGLWDGRPSLGGAWVAHPDAQLPERVAIRNQANGRTMTAALFRRERENPGPPFQVSSDAAETLGLLPGAPVVLEVVALRREEVEVAAPVEENPVVAALDAPVSVTTAPLDPAPAAEPAAAEVATGEVGTAEAAGIVEVVPGTLVPVGTPPLPPVPAIEIAPLAAEAETPAPEVAPAPPPLDVRAILSRPAVPPQGALAQVGIFRDERNAVVTVDALQDAGFRVRVERIEVGDDPAWRILAGPLPEGEAGEAALARIRALGFVDAFVTAEPE